MSSIFIVSPAPFRTVPSEEIATRTQSLSFLAPCSAAPTTSSRISPESHSSIVVTNDLNPWNLSIDIARISSKEPVKKFSIPFFVAASLGLLIREPVVFCKEPCVKNLKYGPRARVMAVRIGESTSSACFMVGAVVT